MNRNSLQKFVWLALFCISCYEEPKPNNNNLTITPSAFSAEANGADAVLITLNISTNATEDINGRAIKVTTSLGYFNESTEVREVTVTTDASGVAKVYLKSNMPGQAVVQASIGTNVARYIEITFTPKIVSLNITSEYPAIVADGIASSRITVTITKATTLVARSITLTTTTGSFSNDQKTITLITDEQGKASTFIKSAVVGVAVIQAALGTEASASTELQFDPRISYLFFSIDQPVLEADGVSQLRVGLFLQSNGNLGGQTISISTTIGTFSNGSNTQSLTVHPSGTAFTYIKSSTVGTAILTASYGADVVEHSSLSFVKAVPESITVGSDVLQVTSGAENLLILTVQLSRTNGNPSPGYIPTVEAVDANGVSVGIFTTATPSDATGKSQIRFAVPDKTYTGNIRFRAKLQLAASTYIISEWSNVVLFKAGS